MIRGRDRNGRNVYICRKRRQPEVRHVIRDKEAVDAYVVRLLLERLGRDDLDLSPPGDEKAREARIEAAEFRERLVDATDAFTAGSLSAATLGRIERDLLPRIARSEERARRSYLPAVVADLSGPDVAVRWDALTIEQQRAAVKAVADVTIVATAKRRTFDPDAVVIEWRLGQ